MPADLQLVCSEIGLLLEYSFGGFTLSVTDTHVIVTIHAHSWRDRGCEGMWCAIWHIGLSDATFAASAGLHSYEPATGPMGTLPNALIERARSLRGAEDG